MLQKIRDKAQGFFAWVILILICVPFALWGIQNYIDVGQETPVATVGDREFFQRDVNRAYEQFSQQYAGQGISEEILKEQALKKLVGDEVLLQYVKNQGLMVSDNMVRDYIRTLQYFQVDGKFDKKQYQLLLSSQNLSSAEFAGRIRNALLMGQFQNTVINSGFTTDYEVNHFFKIQNQKRGIEYVSIGLPELTEVLSETEISDYYNTHAGQFQLPEQVAVEYVELSLEQLAKDVAVNDEDLQAYYEEQKDLYTQKERRKISHILFKFNKDSGQDEQVLEKAQQAKQRLLSEDFAAVAAELSEDKLTAVNGGDLGLFTVGDMEPAFEEAVLALEEGEISKPVKSAFGYHLIKVTELEEERIKSFAEAKQEITRVYQKSKAENSFFELGETLTEVSFENPDNLQAVADNIGLDVKSTEPFSPGQGVGIAAEAAFDAAAFSEDVLQGNNSEPLELGENRLVILRKLSYQESQPQPLEEVLEEVKSLLTQEKSRKKALQNAEEIRQQIVAGAAMQELAEAQALAYKSVEGLERNDRNVPFQLTAAVFKAAKPKGDSVTTGLVALPGGEQIVYNVLSVQPGSITEKQKAQLDLAKANISRVKGQSDFTALLQDLQNKSDVSIRE